MGNRIIITFECKICASRNYTSTKNKRVKPGKLEFKKYCPRCRVHTLHRETK